jgi:hypothetical protein
MKWQSPIITKQTAGAFGLRIVQREILIGNPKSEFRIPNSEFRIPKSEDRKICASRLSYNLTLWECSEVKRRKRRAPILLRRGNCRSAAFRPHQRRLFRWHRPILAQSSASIRVHKRLLC